MKDVTRFRARKEAAAVAAYLTHRPYNLSFGELKRPTIKTRKTPGKDSFYVHVKHHYFSRSWILAKRDGGINLEMPLPKVHERMTRCAGDLVAFKTYEAAEEAARILDSQPYDLGFGEVERPTYQIVKNNRYFLYLNHKYIDNFLTVKKADGVLTWDEFHPYVEKRINKDSFERQKWGGGNHE